MPSHVCAIKSEDIDDLPVNMTHGFVGDKEIHFLLDTGCRFPVLLDAKLVDKKNYTRETVSVTYANNTKDILSIVKVLKET